AAISLSRIWGDGDYGGGSVPPPEPPPEPEEVTYLPFTDDFDDGVIDTSRYFANTGVTEAGGTLNIPTDTWRALTTLDAYDLRNAATAIEVPAVAGGDASTLFLVATGHGEIGRAHV